MSAVYEDVKRNAIRKQSRGFATMHGDPTESDAASFVVSASTTVGQHVGSVFLSDGTILYAFPREARGMGDPAEVVRVLGECVFPVFGQTHTSTMSLGGEWLASEPELDGSEVVSFPWARKVIHSGKVHIKTAQLARRQPRTIVGDYIDDPGNA